MATSLGEAVLELKADADGLKRDMSAARTGVEAALQGLGAVGGALISAGLTAATAGIAALGTGLGVSIRAAADAQEVQAQLSAVLQSTGGAAGVTAEMVNALADELSRMTPFEDEAIVSAESLLLTFTNISQDVFPDATRIVLDMSQALGQDLKTSAIQLGKALQDPIDGVTALQRVGVNFNDAQMEIIRTMVEAGDVMGAQKLILQELQTKFGGSAEAAGKTFGGQLKILKTQLGDIGEQIGGAVLPALSELANKLMEYLGRPEVQAAITAIAEKVGEFAASVAEAIPAAIDWFGRMFGWLSENKGVIVGALAAIGVAIAAFVYTTVIPAAVAMISATWPILAIMAAVAAVAYLVYTAWTNNWGGIRDAVMQVWGVLQPVFEAVIGWLREAIPAAVAVIVSWWGRFTGVIMAAWSAVQPVLRALWDLFAAIADFVGAVFSVVFTALAGIWQNVLVPAMQAVWGWLSEKLSPVFDAIGKVLSDHVLPAIQAAAEWFEAHLAPAIEAVAIIIERVVDWIETMADKIRNIELPDWMTPGSPTPWEIGLRGVADAMRDLAREELPELQTSLRVDGASPGMMAQAAAAPVWGAQQSVNLHVGVLVADRSGLEELERRLRGVRLIEEARLGV